MSGTPNVSSRERLLEAARSLFAERGYEGTTTAEIAKHAKTSQSQLLKYFKDKPGLLAAALEQGWRELNTAIRLAIARMASLSDQAKLIVDMLLSYLEQDRIFRTLFLLESDRRDTQDRGAREFTKILERIFRDMSSRGELRPNIAPRALTSALIGALKNVLREHLLSGSPGDALSEAQAELLFSNFLSSCIARPRLIPIAKLGSEAQDEQPWVDHYLELADKVIYARRGRLPRA